MDWLTEPLALGFVQRSLVAGLLTALTCSLVGTWVVLRGLSFMGDALAHGVVPGIAVAALVGFDLTIGAAGSALVMIWLVTVVGEERRVREDTGIGLLFVGMLGLGVIIISRSDEFAFDLSSALFGAALGITRADIVEQAVALVLAVVATVAGYRAFLVLAFDERKAASLGFSPRLARAALLGLIALATVASFRTVGSLLVFGLLVGPPATASLLVRRVPAMMAVAALVGMVSVLAGLLASYHYDLAAGASMATSSVAAFFVVLGVQKMLTAARSGLSSRRRPQPA